MKREDIVIGETYAVLKRVDWKSREWADQYVKVIDDAKWWHPNYSYWSHSGEPKLAGYEGKTYKVSGRARKVDKYPSDGTKGVLCIRVNDDGEPVGDHATVVSTASIRMTKAEWEVRAANMQAARKRANELREKEQAEKFARWEDMNSRLTALGLPPIKKEVKGWNGVPREEWSNTDFVGSHWRFSTEDVEAIIERVYALDDMATCYALGEDY